MRGRYQKIMKNIKEVAQTNGIENTTQYDYNGLGNRVGKRFGEPVEPVTPQMSIYDVELNLYTQYQDVIDLSVGGEEQLLLGT